MERILIIFVGINYQLLYISNDARSTAHQLSSLTRRAENLFIEVKWYQFIHFILHYPNNLVFDILNTPIKNDIFLKAFLQLPQVYKLLVIIFVSRVSC